MTAEKEFRLGWFSLGDLISLATVVFFAGIIWSQTRQNTVDIESLRAEQAIQRQMLMDRFVLKDDYHDDIKEIKDLLRDMSAKLDSKADKK